MTKGRRHIETSEVDVTLREVVEAQGVIDRLMAQPVKNTTDIALFDRLLLTRREASRCADEQSAYQIIRMKLLKQTGRLNEQTQQYEWETAEAYKEFARLLNELLEQPQRVRVAVFTQVEIAELSIAAGLSVAERLALEGLLLAEAEIGA